VNPWIAKVILVASVVMVVIRAPHETTAIDRRRFLTVLASDTAQRKHE